MTAIQWRIEGAPNASHNKVQAAHSEHSIITEISAMSEREKNSYSKIPCESNHSHLTMFVVNTHWQAYNIVEARTAAAHNAKRALLFIVVVVVAVQSIYTMFNRFTRSIRRQ